MELFVVAIFVVAFVCALAIMVVGCLKPDGPDAHQRADVDESHPLEASVH